MPTNTAPELDLGTPAPSMMDVLSAAEASALIDAIEATENAVEDAEAAKAAAPKGKRIRVPRGIQLKKETLPVEDAPNRVKVRNVKAQELVAPSEGKRLTPRVDVSQHVHLEPGAVYYKLESTPRGKALFTYTLAVFSVLGGFTQHRASMDPEKIRAFFRSKTILYHHHENGNLEETSKGVRLSTSGWNYFYGRITGSTVAQKVDEPEMKALANAIKSGNLDTSTARFEKSVRFVPIA